MTDRLAEYWREQAERMREAEATKGTPTPFPVLRPVGVRMKLTAGHLRSLDACPDQVEIFESRWPDGIEAAAITADALEGFDLAWIATHLLTDSAWREFRKIQRPALVKYWKTARSAMVKYCNATSERPPWAEYENTVRPALAEGLKEGFK